MKKLNTYLMGMMSVAVCLFSVACSSDDDNETAPKENGKVVTVEAVFANDGVTRAVIGDPDAGRYNKRPMSFEEGDVLRLVGKAKTDAENEICDFTAATSGGGTKCHFYGTIKKGNLDNYKAYLIPKGSSWEEGVVPSISGIASPVASLQEAFTKQAVISGEYVTDKYVLSLQNAFVVNNKAEEDTLFYYDNVAEAVNLPNKYAVAVAANVFLKKATDKTGTKAAASTIYAFKDY